MVIDENWQESLYGFFFAICNLVDLVVATTYYEGPKYFTCHVNI